MDSEYRLREILNTLTFNALRRVAVSLLRRNGLYDEFRGLVTDFGVSTFGHRLVDYLTEVKQDYIIACDENTALLMVIVALDARL